MSESTEVVSAELKEGYWVRIGDESYAVHRVLSVSVEEPQNTDDGSFEAFCCFLVPFGLGIFAGMQTNSWIVGIVSSLLLLFGINFLFRKFNNREERNREEREKRMGFPRNVTIELDKKGSRVIAEGLPKADAERLQMEIESIVASAARAESQKDITNKAEMATPRKPSD
jgi:hypothetical protein